MQTSRTHTTTRRRSRSATRTAARRGWTVPLIGLGLVGALVFVVPVLHLAATGSGSTDGPAHVAVAASVEAVPLDTGEELYISRCMSCHQMNGEGIPGVFPPLANSEWVVGEPGRIIRVVLHGMSGELEVAGTVYSGMMPPWGSFLDDEQIAAILTYVRTSFGNEAGPVTAEEVARVREATAGRKETWTVKELEMEENSSIPEGE